MNHGTNAGETGAATSPLLTATRPSGFHLSDKHIPLKWRSITLQLTTLLYIVFFLGFIGLMAWNLSFMSRFLNNEYTSQEEFMAEADLLGYLGENIGTIQIGVLAVCVIAYSLFVYRAASNISKSKAKGLDYSPGWAVGWSFIPIANLFGIFMVMRGIWIASHDPRRGAYGVSILLPLWWLTYIGGNISANMVGRSAEQAMLSLDVDVISGFTWTAIAVAGVSIFSGILLILIVRSITRAQDNWKSQPVAEPTASTTTSALGF